jgi:hypothetical protein
MVQTRSDAWTTTLGPSCGMIFRTRTDEVLPRTMQVPVPVFVLAFASAAGATHGASAAVERGPTGSAARLPEPQAAPDSWPEPAAPLANAEEAPRMSGASEAGQAQSQTNRIELIIDSLSRHPLVEPIPVTMEGLGDKVYTATVPDLDITATGHSVGEALLLLKDQIETVYDELSRAPDLEDWQLRTLGALQHYIARSPRRPGWYRR